MAPANKGSGDRRNADALSLRRQGKAFAQIGRHFSVSKSRAHQMVAKALRAELQHG